MTRIIAGSARGARLEVPGAGTRPTSDRVRESLFGALESLSAISGARVLDLYAGSGALGLESLSRGAASAEFVERGRQAAAIVRRNAAIVAKAGGMPSGRVHESAVHAFLQRASGPFDLVFTDPPYDLDDTAMTADLVALAPLLSSDAVVVVERARRSTPPDFTAAGLELFREKSYGDTTLWWAEPASDDESAAPLDQPPTESQSR
ncbi:MULTISPECIES: 16S rRNA (guanine(966)-N(2))-methyltransferase RsmD [unclassified Microbacterium]|uniref:16S rRNA (guanine(966)-N(2))-methyltransferase RsmD n=1 Tax=unclassified Microbacterium TaxID=2609290 RepID=UPI000CFD9D87|nr:MULTISPECIES: 16S rRNA (guanine(966)-N(2))-methyltransferase RsmD [unclassified Microbacterium]PQZ61186.1 16S rRNA (guanine(966)-N(2))-methyltransferase RsmD [Microbacterium sp. MYb43]PQZ82398.1 16S rRNA (guanine(966)-N(2))-methyltransferase RsmD [Microbacterium sp. MYb40]PRB23904.1 16S rRNA (guanine(966)-N(2))-methyltransferase RsmD [Microbacterium sp. MYb54]PRB29799.1 16S rRNA (guanine(966)-N(2))-methyltransferase RsmD [Microbacterium sp. MYb50]PRB70844.1 16S rRNA (guanine(966)-N(2))-meth